MNGVNFCIDLYSVICFINEVDFLINIRNFINCDQNLMLNLVNWSRCSSARPGCNTESFVKPFNV